jgi:hypothetical protein
MLATALASVALLPGLLTTPVADVEQDSKLPILLPSTMTVKESKKLYGGGEGSASNYSFSISTDKDCGGANACSVAWFSGSKGGKAYGERSVKLTKGRKGKYTPLSCGGSCSPPSITWKERGVVYEIQVQEATRASLIKLANAAIRKGPR